MTFEVVLTALLPLKMFQAVLASGSWKDPVRDPGSDLHLHFQFRYKKSDFLRRHIYLFLVCCEEAGSGVQAGFPLVLAPLLM